MARPLRKFLVAAGVVVLTVGALSLVLRGNISTTTVTRARLERSLERTYSNRYVALADILGHDGVTVESLDSHAVCDKGGPTVADRGPGGDWICYIAYRDPNVPNPDGAAKVELNVHSSACYTAVGSTRLVGPLNITDTRGRTVVNPAAEFDGCFDPHSPGEPDGTLVIVQLPPLPGTVPQLTPLKLPVGSVKLDMDQRLPLVLTCAAGGPDCTGKLSVALQGEQVASRDIDIRAGTAKTLRVELSTHQARDGGMVTLTPKLDPTSVLPAPNARAG